MIKYTATNKIICKKDLKQMVICYIQILCYYLILQYNTEKKIYHKSILILFSVFIHFSFLVFF